MTKNLFSLLYVQVLIAITIGVLLGYFAPDVATSMKPLGEGFIKLIKMIITPLIFCTIVTGIAGMQDMKKVGRVGLKALLYFEVVSSLALIVGLIMVHTIKPGAGMNIDVGQLDSKGLSSFTDSGSTHSVTDFLLNIIPTSAIDAFAKGDILQVLLFSVLFGVSLGAMKETGKPVMEFIQKLSHVLFGIVETIMKLAPVGAFGAMAFTIGKYGILSLASLAKLMLCFYVSCFIFIVVILGLIAKLTGFSIFKFIIYIKDELLIVLGTSSSESVLPRMMSKMEKLGCSRSVVSLVIPTGYSFNLDGTSIYLSMAAIFVAQATNVPLTLTQELTLFAVLLLTSKGAAGVTGSGFITLVATLTAVPGIPVAGLAIILGIDRFMSEARALTNLVGNGVATVVAAKWEDELNEKQMLSKLETKSES